MAGISARELSEWEAYESEYGQLGRGWDREVAAQILETLRNLVYLIAGGGPETPEPVPRANEYKDAEDDREE